ncbi:uncharacterized protein LOC116345009 [Contarinia nasturtii]|uniref:uncharacterized protein LOC116345009 n=1 Tax=Contarinia nasturtii TaxID=265458 RepID=UPI0012D43FBA|nr:uncharacterized protein LOC116345009 [Contarinia nasturtii]
METSPNGVVVAINRDRNAPQPKRLKFSPIEDFEVSKPTLVQGPKFYLDFLDAKLLKKIFDNLELFDLLKMCDEGENFRKIIAEEIMPNRVLNISEIRPVYSVRHAFKKLGQFVAEVSIKQSDIQWKKAELSVIEEILRLIGKRCAAGHLKKVTIIFDMNDDKSLKLNTEIPDVIKTIEKLHIVQNRQQNKKFENCLEKLLPACSQLQSLKLKQIHVTGQLMSVLNTINLYELDLDDFCVRRESWTEFIQKQMPTLKSFICSNFGIRNTQLYHYHIMRNEISLDEIDSAFPAIERLSISPNSYISETTNKGLTTLKSLHVKWYHLIPQVMIAVRANTSLEELSISMKHGMYRGEVEPEFWRETLAGLKKLHSIKIEVGLHSHSWDEIIGWLKDMPSITDVCLIGIRSFKRENIEDVVSLSSELRCLKLDVSISSFTAKMYDTLVRERSRYYRKSPPLNIHLRATVLNKLKQSITEYAKKEKYIRLQALN